MRSHHEGSVFQRQSNGDWIAAVSIPGGRRRTKIARTKEGAEALLATLQRETPPHHLLITGSRSSFADLIARHLAWAADEGWGRQQTADVMSVSLSYARIKFGICGPCVYCGTPYANTVDHVLPVSKGGTDDAANLVSACADCNAAKGSMLVGAFLISRKSRRANARTAARSDLDALTEGSLALDPRSE